MESGITEFGRHIMDTLYSFKGELKKHFFMQVNNLIPEREHTFVFKILLFGVCYHRTQMTSGHK